MDTVHPDDSARTLPSARELLLHVQNKADESPVDKMLVDGPYEAAEPRDLVPSNAQAADSITKPHLTSITNAQPCSPIPRTNSPNQQAHNIQQPAADEYLRHRLSDMSVSASSPTQQRGSLAMSSPMQDIPSRLLSPLEPNSQPYNYESYSRRGSITDPALHGSSTAPQLDFRRPSIAELNNLPLPTSSASASRRGSLATVVTDYEYSSRSPSPSPFAKRIAQEAEYGRRDSLPHPAISQVQEYDPYQRRHSIAIAEAPSSRQASTKYRAFRFPATATIPEAPNHGPYSAPSSPPHSASNVPADVSAHPETSARYPRHGMRQLSSSGTDHQYQYMQRHATGTATAHHPYAGGPSAGGPLLHHRRRSILMDEGMESGPVIARRASMPVVGMRNSMSTHHPPPPHHHHHPHEAAYNGYVAPIEEEKPARKSDTPYSRSPELRVSHKLAERKRRKEMKELFDELRDSLPVEKNLKTSKWEILSKAVEYITMLKRRDFEMENEVNALRREVNMLKRERGTNGSFGPPY